MKTFLYQRNLHFDEVFRGEERFGDISFIEVAKRKAGDISFILEVARRKAVDICALRHSLIGLSASISKASPSPLRTHDDSLLSSSPSLGENTRTFAMSE
jgi:hypothetical protein